MNLDMLVRNLETKAMTGSTGIDVTSLCYDSRRAEPGAAFFALPGEVVDGHDFIDRAVEGGAAAVFAERSAPGGAEGPAWIQVADSRIAMADASREFYENPSADMAVTGITGTNGKTTTAFILHHLLQSTWQRCGLLGTVAYDTGARRIVAERTTPESLDLQGLLAEMRDHGCRGAVMEVSSHGILQHRVRGIDFDVAIFTNLSQDHLDYHGSMDAYFEAKQGLFDAVVTGGGKKRALVINGDDGYGRRLAKKFDGKLPIIKFGMSMGCDFRASQIRTEFTRTTFQLEAKGRTTLVRIPYVGRHNVFNALAALAAGSALGINLRESVKHLADAPQVPGRLQSVADKKPYRVFVDYAHTPDALENVLEVVRSLSPRRIITVFGCGGDRDREKRPLMGRAAEKLSDIAIVTSDNPRSEDPQRILDDIEKGMRGKNRVVIADRREAIGEAIELAAYRDIVVIAGKGHETYQEIGGEKLPFDDVAIARSFIDYDVRELEQD